MMDEMNRVPVDDVSYAQLDCALNVLANEQRESVLRRNAAEMRKIVTGEDDPAETEREAMARDAAKLKDEIINNHDAWERALRAKQMRDDQRESIGIVQTRHADLARLVTRRR